MPARFELPGFKPTLWVRRGHISAPASVFRRLADLAHAGGLEDAAFAAYLSWLRGDEKGGDVFLARLFPPALGFADGGWESYGTEYRAALQQALYAVLATQYTCPAYGVHNDPPWVAVCSWDLLAEAVKEGASTLRGLANRKDPILRHELDRSQVAQIEDFLYHGEALGKNPADLTDYSGEWMTRRQILAEIEARAFEHRVGQLRAGLSSQQRVVFEILWEGGEDVWTAGDSSVKATEVAKRFRLATGVSISPQQASKVVNKIKGKAH
jgi:hypothetical protein